MLRIILGCVLLFPFFAWAGCADNPTALNPDGVAVQLPLCSLAQVITYNENSPPQPLTFTIVYQGNTYTQTLTYSGSSVIDISQWILQE